MLKKIRPVHLYIGIALIAVGLMVYHLLRPEATTPPPQVVPSAPPQQMSPTQPTPDEQYRQQVQDQLDTLRV